MLSRHELRKKKREARWRFLDLRHRVEWTWGDDPSPTGKDEEKKEESFRDLIKTEIYIRKLSRDLKTPSRYLALEDNRDCEEILEDYFKKERISHRSGWKQVYLPTRKRKWRPTNNNWKRHRRTQHF